MPKTKSKSVLEIKNRRPHQLARALETTLVTNFSNLAIWQFLAAMIYGTVTRSKLQGTFVPKKYIEPVSRKDIR
jgi:hypothetical protein